MPNAVLQSCCPKAAESCSPKLLPKIAPQSCVLIATPQRCSPKLRFFKAAVQSCSSKLLPKAAPQSCSPALLHKLCPKLFSKAVARNLRFCKPVYQHVSPKPFCTAAPDSCAPKLLSLPRQLFLKAATKSCFLMPLPKAAVLQSNCPSMLLQCRNIAPHS